MNDSSEVAGIPISARDRHVTASSNQTFSRKVACFTRPSKVVREGTCDWRACSSVSPSRQRLSWLRCSSRNESAGKRKHAAARQGNRHLRAAMTEAARATARTRTRPGARFRRLARQFGKGHEKKAATAVARTLTCIAWAVMARGQDYADAGQDYYDQRDQRNREHLIRHHQQALARLGCQVTLVPPGDSSPPPGQAA